LGAALAALLGGTFGPRTAAQDADPMSVQTLLTRLATATAPAEAQMPEVPALEAPPDQPPMAEPAEPEEPPDIHISPQGRVEMHVRSLDLASVLQMLSLQSQRNIVASQKVSGTVTANLYNVTFEEALTAILDSNGAGWRERGNFIYVYTNEELAAMETATSKPVTRVFRLFYSRATDLLPVIQPLVGNGGSVAASVAASIGLATSKEQAGGDTATQEDYLVVTAAPERLEQIARTIAELDSRPQQILIEATILRAQLNEDNALGIDFNVVGGVDFRNLASVSPGVTDLATGAVPTARLEDTSFTTRTDFNDAIPEGGFTFGLISNNVAAFVRALEQVTDTTVLANPKVLALNKQRGEVIVGRRDGYLTTTVTQTAAVQSVEFLETGTRLIFRPFIGGDGYVRMEVHPEDSTGGITAANLPFEQTTEVTTNIMVKDGHTILIGGLFREVTSAVREQMPILGNIPIAGAMFRNSRDTTQREEIIILLTVHVMKNADDMHAASIQAINDVERYRVGMRQGLQFHGRERLAQAHYRWALQHLECGRISKALWDLDLAINNHPKFLAAIQLKEQLLDQREWEDDGSAIRTFVQRRIREEHGVYGPLFDRPGPPWCFPEFLGPSGFEEMPAWDPTPPPATAPAPTEPLDGAES
jgi:type IV pilus assembly protein PilQ